MQRLREAAATPYVELDREAWAKLAEQTPMPLTATEVERLRGLGDEIDLDEVRQVYLPLTRLLNLYVRATGQLHRATNTFLGGERGRPDDAMTTRTPYVIGVAGSVAVGKSTVARLLRELLARWPDHPRVELVTTDGFLLPNAELERRGLMERKGFPESYDQRALLRFVVAVKSGVPVVTAPIYSHLVYDIVPDKRLEVHSPDILLVEGLNVLQPARIRTDGRRGLAVSDFFDFSIYLDAAPGDVRQWYVNRFLKLRETAFRDPASFFRRFADLSQAEAVTLAGQIWDSINGPNLEQNILPTRGRARLVLHKAVDHTVTRVRLRKV
ncbi:type I pantothenate kinase [Tenggerimyces flavus]|uniref:Pantothenate kinase n=1 Tax=Tenggerimyces flavus TaxID=1708749 RepID=A0ABV7Y9I9_9ACTN|nr:type I pantothenate kinase [Tenggerimyces flavus]MBM7785909.1 type I pantothenate kinase [Tenggerimyces flavus]